MKNLFFLLVFILPISINAQGWDKVFPPDTTVFGSGFTIGFETALTSDGGYLLAGEVDLPTGAIRHYLRLVKTDELGNLIWQHTYDNGDVINEEVHFVKELSNQEIIIGSSKSGLPRLVKTDALGNPIWEKTYQSDTSHFVRTGIVCPDGNYLLAGYSVFGSAAKFFVLKFDQAGDLIWKKYHTQNEGANPLDVKATSDGGFIMTGSLNTNAALFKLNNEGDLEWTQPYVFSTYDSGFTIKQTSDGGYIVGGVTTGINGNLPLVFKTDSLGNGEWTKILSGNAMHQVSDIILKSDGNYVAVGALQSFWGFSQNGFIIELDQQGEEIWSEDFTSQNQQISTIKHIPDDGYILAGAATEGMLLKKIGGTTSLENYFHPKFSIDVYPNPMDSQTTFDLNGSNFNNVQLQVFDVTGKMVREETHVESSFIFYKENLTSGIYFYKIKDGNVLLGTGKFVID